MCLGIPGRIVTIDDAGKKLATVDVSGVRRQVNIACIRIIILINAILCDYNGQSIFRYYVIYF